jgi:hypothetical protein
VNYIFSAEFNDIVVAAFLEKRRNIGNLIFRELDKVSVGVLEDKEHVNVAEQGKFGSFLDKTILSLIESNLKKFELSFRG